MPCSRWNSNSRPFARAEVDDGRCRVRIVRRELRIHAPRALEQDARAGEVGDVGVGLARVDRVAGQAAFLCALDLAVPVGALHEPDVQHARMSRRRAAAGSAARPARASNTPAPRARARPSRRARARRAAGRGAAATARAAPPPRRRPSARCPRTWPRARATRSAARAPRAPGAAARTRSADAAPTA